MGSMGLWVDPACSSMRSSPPVVGRRIVSSDRDVWGRVVMFDVVTGGVRKGFPVDQIPWVVNFRMPELLAAVALLQLGRLAGLLSAIWERKRMLLAGFRFYLLGKNARSRKFRIQRAMPPWS